MTLSIFCRFDPVYSASHVQLYPSLVRQRGARDVRDNILLLLLFLFLLLDPLVGFGMHLLPVLGWAFSTLVFLYLFWGLHEQTRLAFIIYYRMDFDILFGEFKILPMAFFKKVNQ